MSTLVRINYIDTRGFLTNEWFPTEMTAGDRVKELDTLGMESIDMENVDIPWEGDLQDLIHWLNLTPNTPRGFYSQDKTVIDEAFAQWGGGNLGLPLDEQIARNKARAAASPALDNQVGGDHYKKLGDHQPWAVLRSWLTPDEFRGYMKGQAIAYLARERDKGGDEDVAKAGHYLEGLLELQKKD